MKFSALILLIALACVSAVVVPYTECPGSIAKITAIEGSEWPPVAGEKFVLKTYMDSPVAITAGTFEIISRFAGMTVDTQRGNLCNFGDISCPTEAASDIVIFNEGEFPTSAPSGSYAMKTSGKDAAGNQIFCYVVNFDI